jgi:hypothetical protein
MPYTPKSSTTEYRGGVQILASEHFQFIEGAATLDAAAIGQKYLPVGTAIARNLTTGKFEEYADGGTAEAPTLPEGYDEFSLLNIDVEVDGQNDVIVGEVLIRGSVYDAKLPASATATFKEATKPQIRYIRYV